MRHRNTTKTLGRSKSAREAVLRDLATSIVVYEKIKTTEVKAKTVCPIVEKLITKAKAGDLTARRQLLSYFATEQPVNKLMEVLGPRYKSRNGGYTRIVKIGPRLGDGAPVVQIELV
ncbi:50S ribosomal protein L17 [Candidatus Uhrbacteria bacterium CG_4_9_14_0_2_um_filter_41_50]|uniref:Large ribosomal subunit protein bL17 n=1 Tax=Candidatus Uhrbacteria bacterium CG_4_9_14_0_2_um_filter_41_50 TaxID=1975031 RepID=A0A2M8EPY7_9BACT|nr:MAG: 50S ribosomal protein L17 [Candidatus Uhrbacteria bacterium CG_4_10_14_3_um_filter_41_21]PIZ54642.1 MAG: 50S ribosomal protein L17 [Candidatus Uhrbacteria bacterium CG_4_10_14_0_2_um_filter_41_21]PJB84661.1 MAG: 50S ribosomal protein L17 [Candidatus Uhrbacteria bacterium CG_4_9_14_0_8_um_filter_41_16]PJC24792.1 MAG: 50S ribosomal protein L17 [Candidatus Uhrbacteria bacterium CG_4_9_14_0_2_um_filter_41_50]PJE75135.1 MAG: 50S ribosomal protein L17 [Candidatus Uhrbacteria bacterium CG10_bi